MFWFGGWGVEPGIKKPGGNIGMPPGIWLGMPLGMGGNWKPKPGTGGGTPMVFTSRSRSGPSLRSGLRKREPVSGLSRVERGPVLPP